MKSSKKLIRITISIFFVLLFALNIVYAEPTKYVQEIEVGEFEEINCAGPFSTLHSYNWY